MVGDGSSEICQINVMRTLLIMNESKAPQLVSKFTAIEVSFTELLLLELAPTHELSYLRL